MNYRTSVNWATVQTDRQIDWVDHVINIETWLEQHISAKGDRWDWLENTACSQVGFTREQDCVWFILNWS